MEKKRSIFAVEVLVSISVLLFVLEFQSNEVLGQAGYPSKPIELVGTDRPGAQPDVAQRMLAEFLKQRLGQPVIVVSKPGAGGMLGTNYLAKAIPDGYTITSIGDAQTITAFLLHKPPYKLDELRGVCLWGYHNNVMAVPADSPWKTMKEFIEYAKKNPGVKYCHPGKGYSPWVQVQFLAAQAGIQIEGVPFNADALASAIMGKQVPIGICGYTSASPQAEAGKLRMLMTFTPGGIEGEPNLPTLKEVLGKDVMIYPPVMAIFVPAKTPESVVQTLRKAVKEITSDPTFLSKMKELGVGVKFGDEEEFHTRQKYMTEVIKKIFVEARLTKD